MPSPLSPKSKLALWNPATTIFLSLFFGPIFGAYIAAKNWEALGMEGRQWFSMAWVYVSTTVFLVDLNFFSGRGDFFPVGYLAILLWILTDGIIQLFHFRSKIGGGYTRKGWGEPVAAAFVVIAIIGVVASATILILE